MPEKDPANYSLLTYLWVIAIASWGGVVSFHRKMRAGHARAFNIVEFIGITDGNGAGEVKGQQTRDADEPLPHSLPYFRLFFGYVEFGLFTGKEPFPTLEGEKCWLLPYPG